jgi:hypothetical protein
MKNKKYTIQKDLVFLTLSMFITTCLWIGFNVYDAYATSTISKYLELQIIPINGSFDINTLEAVKSRPVILPDYSGIAPTGEVPPDITNDETISAPPPDEPPALPAEDQPADIPEPTLEVSQP